ncbi:MAG: beta-lactamase family protein [bacterium]|nr:beta-lactamase family protein [bacterium]
MQSGIRSLIDKVARQHHFSGTVRIAARSKVMASAAFGCADRTHGVDNTTDTRFGIASGTKLFTALGIGALIDDSRLALDTRLHDACSVDLSGVARDVTIAQLLTHKSGVYDYYDEDLIDSSDAFELSVPSHKLLRPRDYLPMVVGGKMKFAPGERFSYSNGGYVLLGMLIEELCGDYHQFIESRVMKRAGMDSSGFFRLDQLPERTANGYIETDRGWRTNIYALPVIGGPDGGAFVTTLDMERLWRAFLSGEIISTALTRTFTRKAAWSRESVYYGHGVWIHDDSNQPPVIYVVGSDAGVSFKSSCHGDDIVATVVSNTSNGAWPMVNAVDGFLRQEFHRGSRPALEGPLSRSGGGKSGEIRKTGVAVGVRGGKSRLAAFE